MRARYRKMTELEFIILAFSREADHQDSLAEKEKDGQNMQLAKMHTETALSYNRIVQSLLGPRVVRE
jgi:hypothetical protein